MAETYLRRSALAHLGLRGRADATEAAQRATAGVRMSERPHRCRILLRGRADDARFRDAIRGTTGLNLPEANRVARTGDLRMLWLGPDEWLLIGPSGREAVSMPALIAALSGQYAMAIDQSDMRTTISLAGRSARDLINCGCGLDLHPDRFAPGQCAQTGLARANVILERTGSGQTDEELRFDLHVAISYADYLWQWLERAGAEFGVAVEEDA
ncbi:MAG: sarcosine oxidase subunit gamma family protein [Dongiaceae bacterium]